MKNRTMHLGLPLALALFAFAPPLLAQGADSRRAETPGTERTAARQEDPRITHTKDRYGFAAWPQSVERKDGLPLAELAFPGVKRSEADFAPGGPVTLHFTDEDGAPRFLVELSIRETVAEARDVLVEYLTFVNSPRPVPRAAGAGITAGDIGFVGFAPRDRISWIAFVRGNVAVRVLSTDPTAVPHPNLRLVAEAVDGLLRSRPSLGKGDALTRPAVTRFAATRAACRAGEPVVLELATAANEALRWTVGGPGLGYVERDDAGRWVLHTTGPGAIGLTVDVLGTNGVIASRTTRIEVADD